MNEEIEVASRIWPHHAEMCSEEDWKVLQNAVQSGRPIDEKILVPVGENKDLMLTSLTILYWTMKIVNVALQISNEVKDLRGKEKIRALVSAVTARLPTDGPKVVYDRIMDIVSAIRMP